jgi:RHS repeat-associated protein
LNRFQKRSISIFLVVCLVFSIVLDWNVFKVKAEEINFNQGDGYSNNAYDFLGAQPTAFNWKRLSRFSGPSGPLQKWTYKTGGAVESSPVISNDGTVYVGSDDSYLYAFDLNGNLKWKYKTEGKIIASPSIDKNGIIYTVSDNGKLYTFNNKGILQWSVPVTNEIIKASPAIGIDGTIYFGGLHAVNPNGSIKWSLNINALQSSPAVAKDGTIYVGANDGKLYAVNSDGTQKWTFTTSAEIASSLVISDDGIVYVASKDSYIYALNVDGTLKWKFKADSSVQSSPAIDKSGNIYVGCDNGYLYSISSSGTLNWKQLESNPGSAIKSTPLIDQEGTIYIDNIRAINKDGSLKWSAPAGSGSSSVAISSNGLVILGSGDGTVYAIGEGGSTNVMVQSFDVKDIDSNTKTVSGVLKNATGNSVNANLIIEGYDSSGKLLSINNSSLYVNGNNTNTFQKNLDFGSRISQVKVYVLDKITSGQMGIREFNEVTDSNNNKSIIGLIENGTANSNYANVVYEGYDSNGNLVEIKDNTTYVNAYSTSYFKVNEDSKNVSKVKVYAQDVLKDGKTSVLKSSLFKGDDGKQHVIGILGNGTNSSVTENLIIECYDANNNLIEIKNSTYWMGAGLTSTFNYNIDSSKVSKVNAYVQQAYTNNVIEVKKSNLFKGDGGKQHIIGFIGNGTSTSKNANLLIKGYDSSGKLIEIKSGTYYIGTGVTSTFSYTMDSSQISKVEAAIVNDYTDGKVEVKESELSKEDDGKQHIIGFIGNGTNTSTNANFIAEGYDANNNLIEIKNGMNYITAGNIDSFDYRIDSSKVTKVNSYVQNIYTDGKVEVKKSNFFKGDDGNTYLIGIVGNGTSSNVDSNLMIQCYDGNGNLIEVQNNNVHVSKGYTSDFKFMLKQGSNVTKVDVTVLEQFSDGTYKIVKSVFGKNSYGDGVISGVVSNGTAQSSSVIVVGEGCDGNGNTIEVETTKPYVNAGFTSDFSMNFHGGDLIKSAKAYTLNAPIDGTVKVLNYFSRIQDNTLKVSGLVSNGTDSSKNTTIILEGYDKNNNLVEIKNFNRYVEEHNVNNFEEQLNYVAQIDHIKAYVTDNPSDGYVSILKYGGAVTNNEGILTGLISNGKATNASTNIIAEAYDSNGRLIEIKYSDISINANSIYNFSINFDSASQISSYKVYTVDSITPNELKFINTGVRVQGDYSVVSSVVTNGMNTYTSFDIVVEGYDANNRLVEIVKANRSFNPVSCNNYEIQLPDSLHQIKTAKIYTTDKDTSGKLDIIKYGYRVEGSQLLVTSLIGNGTSQQQDTGLAAVAYDENNQIIVGGGTQVSLQAGEIQEANINLDIGNKKVDRVEVTQLKNTPTSNDVNNRPENNPDGEYADKIIDLKYVKPEDSEYDGFYGSYNINDFFSTIEPVNPKEVFTHNNDNKCVTLPTSSYITLAFDEPAVDSIFVEETGAAGDYGLVEVSSDNKNFTPIGIAINGVVTQFNLKDVNYNKPVTSVKIVGLDNNGTLPGFDVVGVWTGKKSVGAVDGLTGASAFNFFNSRYHISTQDSGQKSQETMQAEPIDTSTGAHYLSRNLLTENGTPNLEFNIDYNSLLLNKDSLGKGWSNNFEAYLEEDSNKNIVIHWSANRINRYLKYNDTSYIASDSSNRYDKLIKNKDNTYKLTKENQESYIFDSQGCLIKKLDKNSHEVDLSYNSNGKLNKVTDILTKHYFKFTYDNNGLISEVMDGIGRKINFSYDSNNNLISIKDANNQTINYMYDDKSRVVSAKGSDGTTIFTNTYDEKSRVVKQLDSKGQPTTFNYSENKELGQVITTMTERNGKTKVLTHDSKYRLASVKDEEGTVVTYDYDSNDNPANQKDGNGNSTQYVYDDNGNILTITDPAKNITTMTYDERNNLLTMTNAQHSTVNYDYDSNNNVLRVTDALGNDIKYTYNSNGLISSKINSEGGVTKYYYKSGMLSKTSDPQGTTINFDYDAAGRNIAVTDYAGNKVKIYYDANDNVTKSVDALGNTTTYTYDCYDNKLSETNPMGKTTSYKYDSSGKLISMTDSLNNVTKYEYDEEQHLIKTTDPKGNVTQYTVDGKGRVLEVTDALGNKIKTSYDGNDNVVSKTDALGTQILTVAYDVLNNPIKSTDGLGRTTANQYDSLNILTNTIDPMGNTTKLDYDENDRLKYVTDAAGNISSQSFDADGNQKSVTDANNNTTNFNYDYAGRISSKTNASNGTTNYYYNLQGHLAKIINGRNQTTTFTYDADGRIKTLTDPIASIAYTYDTTGKITSISENNSTISKKYDSIGRMISYTDGNGNNIKYQYDANSNITSITYPDGKIVKYDYDALNRLIKVTDWANRVTQYQYDANGRVLKEARANGTACSYSYDVMGQVISINDIDSLGNKINSYNYNYDNNGNIVNESASFEKHNIAVQNSLMTFTGDNRIATYNNKAVNYDADGNMTNGPLNGLMKDYTYDSRNRLVETDNTVYNYDSENHRTLMVENGLKTSYVTNPNSVLSQVLVKTDSKNVSTYYIYGLGLIAQDGTDGYKTYHYDKNGSTTAILDSKGNVTDRIQYEPYGKITYRNGNTNSPFLFVGRYGVMTDSNGLYYMRARYYNPEIRRFINQDVVEGNIDDGQSLNQFAYAQGNPKGSIDPSGRWAGVDDGIAVLSGAVIGLAGQATGDAVKYLMTGKFDSKPEDYFGAAIGGVVTGEAALYAVPTMGLAGVAVAGAAGGAVKSMSSQGLKILFNHNAGKEFSWGDVGMETATSAVWGAIGEGIGKVVGVAASRLASRFVIADKVERLFDGSDALMNSYVPTRFGGAGNPRDLNLKGFFSEGSKKGAGDEIKGFLNDVGNGFFNDRLEDGLKDMWK